MGKVETEKDGDVDAIVTIDGRKKVGCARLRAKGPLARRWDGAEL